MVAGDSVISISGILSQQEGLDKEQVTARDLDDCSDLVGGKDRLLETWFKMNYQSSWFPPLMGRGRKKSEISFVN